MEGNDSGGRPVAPGRMAGGRRGDGAVPAAAQLRHMCVRPMEVSMKVHELRTCACGRLVTVQVRRPNHALHAVMSLLTMGLWLIVWLIAIIEAALSRPGRCPCGRRPA